MTKNTIILFSIIFLFACNGNSNTKSSAESDNGYADGKYCAQVEYYYSKTGTNSTYTLEVKIEDNKLTVIYWPSGGWLDDSHFTPPDISDGDAKFKSDKNVEYEVKIIDKEDCTFK